MNTNKTNYDFAAFNKVEGANGTVVTGYFEGWTYSKQEQQFRFRTVNVKGTEKKVANANIVFNATYNKVAYTFGEDFAKTLKNENGKVGVFVDVTLWDKVAERLEKLNLNNRSKVGVFGTFKVTEYDKNDGTKGLKLTATGSDFKLVSSLKKSETPQVESIDDEDIPF